MLGLSIGMATVLFSVSCTTTYDHHGRPTQSVDPGVAIAGAAAAGLVGYAISNNRQSNRNRRNHHHVHHHPHHPPHPPQHVRRHYR